MGIKQLFSIVKEEAPDAIKEGEIKNQFGRKVAIVSWAARNLLGPQANIFQDAYALDSKDLK
jgi:flap endonuclease-1